ncbi:MAG: LacI family transcriptional regulator [Paenibacillaceae bacterium]|nr:LacI family transcriptional regulator [Paenibacillaceae bacterium]
MKSTIYDVAEAAGVSIATVSYVVNGKRKVAAKTRAKVLQAMEQLQFQPNLFASALMGKSTFTIGLLVPDISNPFFAHLARAIEDEGRLAGYTLFICSTDSDPERLARYLNLLAQKSVDGLVIATGAADRSLFEPLLAQGMPLAQIAREIPRLPVQTVLVDDYEGGRLAAEHLLQLGHRQVGIVAEQPGITSSEERLNGFRHALEDEAAAVCLQEWVVHCEAAVSSAKDAGLRLLRRHPRPSAVFACNDLLAVGILQAARELDLKVPEQLSVVSFDDTVLASATAPALTAVSQPINHMGKLVIGLLLQEIKGEQPVKQRIIVRPELLARGTTAAAALETDSSHN